MKILLMQEVKQSIVALDMELDENHLIEYSVN